LGWEHFSNYVNDSLLNAVQLKSSRGEVVIRFSINNKGQATKVKIKKHLSTPCDAEAVRIIKSQTWKLNDPEAKVEAIVQF
jgi:outer membrane biosynthesis protein TonB